MENSKLEPFSFERYKLILYHEFVDTDGVTHPLEDPIAACYNILQTDRERLHYDSVLIINEMIDKLKAFMIKSVEEMYGRKC